VYIHIMYIYICVRACVCVIVCIYIYACIYICMCLFKDMCIYVHIYVYIPSERNVHRKISKVISLLNLVYIITVKLIFENA